MNLEAKKHSLQRTINKGEGKGVKKLTPRDKALSLMHLRDSIKYNLKHAKDHMEAVKVDKQMLNKRKKS